MSAPSSNVSTQVRNTIGEINVLIDEITKNFNVDTLQSELTAYINALKEDRKKIEVLNMQIIEERKKSVSATEFEELKTLNSMANNALVASKAQLEKYRATLNFLKKLSV